jgi:hypothetical protein
MISGDLERAGHGGDGKVARVDPVDGRVNALPCFVRFGCRGHPSAVAQLRARHQRAGSRRPAHAPCDEASELDVRWKCAAGGLDLDDPGFVHTIGQTPWKRAQGERVREDRAELVVARPRVGAARFVNREGHAFFQEKEVVARAVHIPIRQVHLVNRQNHAPFREKEVVAGVVHISTRQVPVVAGVVHISTRQVHALARQVHALFRAKEVVSAQVHLVAAPVHLVARAPAPTFLQVAAQTLPNLLACQVRPVTLAAWQSTSTHSLPT